MPLKLRYIARSDVGLVREGNEDSGYAGPRLLAIADGMGGHAAGEVASSATIEELVQIENAGGDRDPLRALRSAVKAANDRIRTIVAADPERHGMGTTLTALLWTGEALALAHIGDSRAYLLREGILRRITHDHTFVQSLVDEGRITEDEASVHPARAMILRALQGDGDPDVDLEMIEVRAGDRLLVCSDGLSGVVRDTTLRDTLVEHEDLAETAEALVGLALKAGAPDNITCVVADVIETEVPPAADDTAEVFLVGAASGELPPAHPEQRSRRGPAAAMRGLLGSSESTRRSADEGHDDEELRYAPRPPRRFRWLRRLAVLAVAAAVVWAGVRLADDYVNDQYYVGDQAGEVAIFRGVSQEVGPLRLSSVHEIAADLPIGSLPTLYRNRVTDTIPAADLPEAEQIVASLRREACRAHAPEVAPTPTPTPSPTSTPGTVAMTPRPGSTLVPAPTTPTPTPGRTAPALPTTPVPTITPRPLPTAPPGYPGLDCMDQP
ncbi:MAG TPA: PP2C family serine/threonine-protein phosphatase [Jiangellaceae bacterium]|nr:PP2C family serine/threonine-protein phosphatase [Jiangellaceae bacterium]